MRSPFDFIVALYCCACVGVSWWILTPWLASVRTPLLFGAGVAGAIAGAIYLRALLRAPSAQRGLMLAAVLASVAVLSAACLRQQTVKQAVLSASAAELAAVGRHVVAGYHQPRDLEPLIAKGGIGGLFVTARNARGKSVADLAGEIASLQDIARRNGHPPLVVTTDQEGGFVSRLSPPLARPRLLSAAIEGAATAERRGAIVFEEGATVGAGLASVGVTLNLAPLADIDGGIRTSEDRLSRIGERAIGNDAVIVSEVARRYCEGLASARVGCTLKHFPGLGRVHGDTHIAAAVLTTPSERLAGSDWLPYQQAAMAAGAAVMMAHVTVPELDATAPASLSARVTTGLLRERLGFRGVIITDDLCMAAVSDREGGIGAGAVLAQQAGADLLLVSYDPEQVYPVLAALLDEHRRGASAASSTSRQRLDAHVAQFHR